MIIEGAHGQFQLAGLPSVSFTCHWFIREMMQRNWDGQASWMQGKSRGAPVEIGDQWSHWWATSFSADKLDFPSQIDYDVPTHFSKEPFWIQSLIPQSTTIF